MATLVVNVGSSSVRLAVFANRPGTPERLASARLEPDDVAPRERLQSFLAAAGTPAITRVVHRVVHGGERLRAPVPLDATVEREIERLAPLAPLHNPAALRWIRGCREVLGPAVPQLAVFDTAFFVDLPAHAASYALPADLAATHALRRHGFHGLAHEALWRRWCALRPDLPGGGRLVSLQLGSGCSAAALAGGRPLDTSMGFSPLEGLVMATRAGDLDPGLLLHLQRALGLGPDAVEDLLARRSGLLGLSGASERPADLLALDTPRARLALDVYCHRVRKYVGAYAAVLGGLDGIVFGGGVGENVPAIRARVLAGLEFLGVALDAPANAAARGEARLTRAGGPCEAWVIPVDEERLLAERGRALVARNHETGASP